MRITQFVILTLLLLLSIHGQSQELSDDKLTGTVTFITSDHTYIRFLNTEHISIGDTLFKGHENRIPCLRIVQKSSTSVVGTSISDCGLKKGASIFVQNPKMQNSPLERNTNTSDEEIQEEINQPVRSRRNQQNRHPEYKNNERIRGRISGSSYSSLDSIRDRHRVMMRFSLSADHINNSKWSFESFFNYRKNLVSSTEEYTRPTSFFRVYNMSASYQASPSLSLTFGRKINRRISSLGSLDGFQAEYATSNLYLGAIAGLKPDLIAFSLNTDLFQFGGYIGGQLNSYQFRSETTIGILEQRNSGQIDRRFGYVQHASSFGNKIYFFSSLELDLYNGGIGLSQTSTRLTSLYSSINWKIHRSLSLMLSYDSRKRIIYYETFRTELEELLADDLARQGLRFRMNLRPAKYIFAGISVSKRFRSDKQNASDNLNGNISHSKLPYINGRMNINYNWNKSNYLDSRIYSIHHNRSVTALGVDLSIYYRLVHYKYVNNSLSIRQQFYGIGISGPIRDKLTFHVLGELSNREGRNSFRINTKIIKRFYSL